MQIHQLKREHPRKRARQVGRGGKRGKTAGRGTKGQLARAGHKLRPEWRDIIKKIPKLRGYRFASIERKPAVVKLGEINKRFSAGATISPATLLEQGLIRKRGGELPKVKILSGGALNQAFTFVDCGASVVARAQIEKLGGKLA